MDLTCLGWNIIRTMLFYTLLFKIYFKTEKSTKKTVVVKAMIPFKLVHSGFNTLDGAMLLSLQDCMSASVNTSLTIILFNLLAVFFLFIYILLFI